MAPSDRSAGIHRDAEGRATAPATWCERAGALGLLLTPSVVGVAAIVLRRVHVSETTASLVVFAGAAGTSVASLALAAAWYPTSRWRVGAGALAAVVLGLLAVVGVSATGAVIAVDAALVAAAWAIGTSIGRRIEHPGHLLPACVVVACADAASTVSRFGPTHAIAESERALSVVAVAFPVPGDASAAPALGAGDLVFMAIVFGAVAAHGLSLGRAALACLAGTAVAGAGSAVLETAVPALVPIAGAIVLGLPEARRVRPRERRAANVAMVVAASAALAVIASQLIHR